MTAEWIHAYLGINRLLVPADILARVRQTEDEHEAKALLDPYRAPPIPWPGTAVESNAAIREHMDWK